jgi:integrase
MISGKRSSVADKTFGQLLDRYAESVTPKKSGSKWETNRIILLKDYLVPVGDTKVKLGDVHLRDFDERHVSAWRDARLKDVSGSSVIREWTILGNAMKIAENEWKWVTANPFHRVKRPKKNEDRYRKASEGEIDKLIHSSGYSREAQPANIIQRVMAIALFSMQTAMRCKEMTQLKWSDVHIDKKYVFIPPNTDEVRTKTGSREVPLSSKAIAILEQMKGVDDEFVFKLNPAQVDAHWRKLTKKAMIDDLTFHDCKHYACTWMAKVVPVFDLARIVGTKDLKTLLIYYNPTASDIAPSLG